MQELGKRFGRQIVDFINKRRIGHDSTNSDQVLSPEETLKAAMLKQAKEAKSRFDLHTFAETGNLQFEMIPELIDVVPLNVQIRIMVASPESRYPKDDPIMIKIRKILSHAEKRRMDGGPIVVDFMSLNQYQEALKRWGENSPTNSMTIE